MTEGSRGAADFASSTALASLSPLLIAVALGSREASPESLTADICSSKAAPSYVVLASFMTLLFPSSVPYSVSASFLASASNLVFNHAGI
jgi:hypothetical protein